MDIREHVEDIEEIVRAAVGGLLKGVWTAMPSRITRDTENGHVAVAQPTIKRAVTNPATGQITYEDHPEHPDLPIHHMGGGGISKTFPTKKGDTGTTLYAARSMDAWFQSDGTQQPIDDRTHSLSDGMFLSGIRSMPRMLQQVSKDSAQNRSDDKHHVDDLHPVNGHTRTSVDPSTPVASASFDPITQATKFFNSLVHPTNGVAHNATDGGTTHNYGLTHDLGHILAVLNGLHSILSHPTNGPSMNAANGLHTVLAHPTNGASLNADGQHSVLAKKGLGALLSAFGGAHTVMAGAGGVNISSSTAVAISAPPGGLSLPAGGVGSGALASGAASDNVGELGGVLTGNLPNPSMAANAAAANVGDLGGDLTGTLPDPQVVSIANVRGLAGWPGYASDAAAKAGGVAYGAPYRCTGAVAGFSVLAVQMLP